MTTDRIEAYFIKHMSTESNILSKLDRLSILRLAVAFLRTKTYFQGKLEYVRTKTDTHTIASTEFSKVYRIKFNFLLSKPFR